MTIGGLPPTSPASPIATQKTEITSAIKRLREVAPQQPADPRLHWLAPVYVQPLDVRIVLEALFSAERRNEELVRDLAARDRTIRTIERGALHDVDAERRRAEAAESALASLTGQVGEMRERAAKVCEAHQAAYLPDDDYRLKAPADYEWLMTIAAALGDAAKGIRALAPSPPGISTTGEDVVLSPSPKEPEPAPSS